MAKVSRSEYIDTAVRDLRLNPAVDTIPTDTADKIQLTYELKPPTLLVATALGTNSSATSIMTTPAAADIFITSAQMAVTKDVSATSTFFNVSVTQGGALKSIIRINTTTLTIQDLNASVSFPLPGIKVDRNTAINLTASSSTANFTCNVSLTYYVMTA